MIQRRRFVQGAAAATVLGVPHLSGLAQQSVTLKFHTFMAPMSGVWLTMHKPWMEKVEKESGGRIKFEGYPAMQLGGTPVQLYDQARDGVVDIVWTVCGSTAGGFPRIEVFELPFIMNNAEATSKAYWEYFQTQCPDEFKDTHVLALHVHGPGVIHMAKKLIKAPADLRGQLEKAMAEATVYANGIAKEENEQAMAEVKKAGKSEIIDLTADEKKAMKKALVPVHKEMASRIGQDLIDAVYKETGFDPSKL